MRRRRSQLKRKKMSVRNRLPTRSLSQSRSRSRSPTLSQTIEEVGVSPIEMNTVDNTPTEDEMKPEPITYAVNSQALSRLKTKTVSVSRRGSYNKNTKRKRVA